MASAALRSWRTRRARELDDLESAYRALGRTGHGRRASQQLNHAYTVLLSSQFQGYCRDLHSESVSDLLAAIEPPSMRRVLETALLWERRLDRGNPTSGNIGSDFGRLGVSFWKRVHAIDTRNIGRAAKLDQLNSWRNAIAHHDFDPSRLGRHALTLQLRTVRTCQRALDSLAENFDRVMRTYIESVVGSSLGTQEKRVTQKNAKNAKLKVGDRIRFQFGERDIVATVIEDRGNIGHRGRRLLRARLAHEEGYVEEFEVMEEEVTPA